MSKQNRWVLIGGILVVIVGAVIWKATGQPKIKYKEFVVSRGNLQTTILATGTVLPENRLEIKAPVAGRIDTVLAKEGDRVHKGQILAWMSSTDRAALLDAARGQGSDEVKKWEELYKAMPIVAPLPGMIILRNVEPGQTITSNDAIFAMSDRLTVKAQVDETDIANIKLHQKAQIILDSYPDQSLSAIVDQIAYEAKTVSNVTTYLIDVLPDKPPTYLRSGMTANVRFEQEERKDVLLIAAEAITVANGKTNVLVKPKDGEPKEVEIQIGLSDGKQTEVISGLEENQTVLRAEVARSDKSSTSNPFSPFGGQRRGGGGGSGRKK